MPTSAKPTACRIFATWNIRPGYPWRPYLPASDVDAEVRRLKRHDVLDVEQVAHEHIRHHNDHVEEEEAREREARPAPEDHEVLELVLLHPLAEIVEADEPDHEEADDDQRADDRRRHLVADAEEEREVDVGERLDLVDVPLLPEPEPVPARPAEERPDDDERDPEDVEADEEGDELPLPVLPAVVAVPLRIDVYVGD